MFPPKPHYWKLPSWLPYWLRRWLYTFEPARGNVYFEEYCKLIAQRKMGYFGNDWMLIAAEIILRADRYGVSARRMAYERMVSLYAT